MPQRRAWRSTERIFVLACVVALLGASLLPKTTLAAAPDLFVAHAAGAGCDDCACQAHPVAAHSHCPSGQAHQCCALPAKPMSVAPLSGGQPRTDRPEHLASYSVAPPIRPPNRLAA
jgi:hypothetical protein